jgi:hypothetical protein
LVFVDLLLRRRLDWLQSEDGFILLARAMPLPLVIFDWVFCAFFQGFLGVMHKLMRLYIFINVYRSLKPRAGAALRDLIASFFR